MTTSSKIRISTRSILVLVLSLATLACFLIGVFVYSSWLNKSIQSTVQEQVVEDNIQTAKQLTELFREMGIENLQDDHSLSRLQTVVEGIELPNDGFVCVVEEDSGLLLCHPEMRRYPGLRRVAVGKSNIHVQGNDTDIVTAAKQYGGIAGGNADIGGELQMVAVANIPEYGANLLVHQRASGIERAVAKVTGPVRSIGIVVAVLVTLLVFTVNYALVLSYENKLARINEQLEETVRQRTRSLMKTRNAVIFGLAKLAESRDTDTGQHLERIRKYVTILAERFLEKAGHQDADFVEKLALASSLHDIGKVGIPDEILLKPGRFDPEERALMEKHAELGGSCLRAIQKELGEDDFLELSKEIAYCHHEKWDGTG
ncbi:MAG: HD domain-containing phosphohydrolase, partial [Planctomycetota bacterium]